VCNSSLAPDYQGRLLRGPSSNCCMFVADDAWRIDVLGNSNPSLVTLKAWRWRSTGIQLSYSLINSVLVFRSITPVLLQIL